jgi:subtilisin family serine protease
VTFAAPALPISRTRAILAIALAVALSIVSLTVGSASAPRTSLDTRPIQLHFDGYTDSGGYAGSMSNVARAIGAQEYWNNGWTGAGVDIAIIDSGVSPINGLNGSGKVVYGPDVSFESGVPDRRDLDTFGHGTHMAGIIAGHSDTFKGIAPNARIVSLKAADALGRTNVAQVVAAIKWVVQHRYDGNLNIRVLNLSFGADPVRSYLRDDLAYAVERAWDAGIVVVVSGGNAGEASGGLSDPAYDPYVIAVGADNTQGTTDIGDDNVTTFSSRGDGNRNPDVVAPGKSIISLRVPGSYLDTQHPEARVGDELFKGSGTSQAAAVVSGAAALIISQKPNRSPDRVKQILTSTAEVLPDTPVEAQGNGLVDLSNPFDVRQAWAHQYFDASQGSDDNTWANVDATGNSWSTVDANGNSWSSNVWTSNGWVGEGWTSEPTPNGNSWSSDGWLGVSWGKPRTGPKIKASPQANVRGACTEWFAEHKGESWADKTKKQIDQPSLHRGEQGVSWGKRGRQAMDWQVVAFCDWKREQWPTSNVVPTDPDDFRELGVSWGRKIRRASTSSTVLVDSLKYQRSLTGWRVE